MTRQLHVYCVLGVCNMVFFVFVSNTNYDNVYKSIDEFGTEMNCNKWFNSDDIAAEMAIFKYTQGTDKRVRVRHNSMENLHAFN